MFEQDISMDLLMQYGLQATSALIILAAGMLLAKWVGQYIHQTLGKFEMEPPVRLLLIRVVRGMIILLTLLVVLQPTPPLMMPS